MVAAAHASAEIVKLLLAAGADASRTSDEGSSLMYAAGWGRADNVRALLAAGADVNAATKDGKTCLMMRLNMILQRWWRCCWPLVPM
jgi:hypothetical protein